MPQWILLILPLVRKAIEEAPAIKQELHELFSKADATPEDWDALHARIAANTYERLVPHSGLIPTPVETPTSNGL